jgi:hypothetical protein
MVFRSVARLRSARDDRSQWARCIARSTGSKQKPTSLRGSAIRYFKVENLGLRALRESREALTAMWEGLDGQATHGS